MLISYAQQAEDVRLWRLFRGKSSGFYVDVGAGDPVHLSVSKSFYDAGWCGVEVEPGPTFASLRAARSRSVVLNLAVSNKAGRATLRVPDGFEGLSTIGEFASSVPADKLTKISHVEVNTISLSDLFDRYAGETPIDFVKVDVEGSEFDVLSSNDWRRFRPRVLCVEATAPLTNDRVDDNVQALLGASGYVEAAFDGLNAFYCEATDHEARRLLGAPVGVFDEYVHSNQYELGLRVRALEAQVAQMSERESNLSDELASARSNLDASLRLFSESESEFSRIRTSAAGFQAELAAVYESRSWRIGHGLVHAVNSLRGVVLRRSRQ